ncbi:killer cell immunoglobulin-like receptor 2DL3 [Choloepus didactylus]|uniref:killer cell immunoglobulin-like receptor 2DL3 n=1 Tax=Choloepus didactylus TaxID=27675 RepID=UPI00189EE429|nr:killer cell immunoglobulin-like receptor 2DL3 [Choloepus didactylus]
MSPRFVSVLCVGFSLGQRTWAQVGHYRELNILSGLSVVFITIGILLFLLICHWCSTKNRRLLAFSPTNAATIGKDPKEDQKMDGNDPAAEGPPEVIYAQLNHWALTQRGLTPTFQGPQDSSDEPSIYIELPTHQVLADVRPVPKALSTDSDQGGTWIHP